MNKSREIYSFRTLANILDPTPAGEYTLAPHISHAHIYIAIEGDKSPGNAYNPLDASQTCDENSYCYDFGYYEIMEPVNSKAYLKTRFKDAKGYMWKGNAKNVCFTGLDIDVNGSCDLDAFKEAIKKASSTNCATGEQCDTSIPFGIKHQPWDGANRYKPAYDYQGKEKHFDTALHIFAAFIYNINFLSTSVSGGQTSQLENWIINGETPEGWENPFDTDNSQNYKFDYQSFLKIMAFDVAIGSWDDYWYNKNNFVLYFERDSKIVYFIPNDYDTVLGSLPERPECGKLMGTVPLDTFGLSSSQQNKRPLISRILEVPTFYKTFQQAVSEIKSSINKTIENNYSQFTRQYQLICRNFNQSKGADCSASDPEDFLCKKPQYTNNGTDVHCDSEHYLTIPNQTKEMNDAGLQAARSRIVADLPVWYGAQFYRLYSSTRYGTQRPTANFFLTSRYNIETGFSCN